MDLFLGRSKLGRSKLGRNGERGGRSAPSCRTAATWKELKKDKKTVIAFRGGYGLFCPKIERSIIL